MTGRGAIVCCLVAVMAACTGSSAPRPSPSSISTPSPTSRRLIRCGEHPGCGGIVVAAEQWPDCLNPITGCAAPEWYWWTIGEQVLPRAMQLDGAGVPQASPLLTETPTFADGDLEAGPPFTITFRLAADAVWADGTPLTSRDFVFTWRAIVSTQGSFGNERYANITSIDDSDPHVVRIELAHPDATWTELFGGARGFILEAAAFPAMANREHPDLSHEMQSSIPFSGGPWILKDWSKHQAVLVPNERSLWPVPILPQLTFVPRTDRSTESQALFSGKVAAMYLVPGEDVFGNVQGLTSVKAVAGPGTTFDALWFNQRAPLMGNLLVRKAVAYTIDRKALLDRFVRPLDSGAAVLDCGFVGLSSLGTCPSSPFTRYRRDIAKARSLLQQAGYDCSQPTCTKDGQPLTITVSASGGRAFDAEIEQALLEQLDTVGFYASVREPTFSESLFGLPICPPSDADVLICGIPDSPSLDLASLLRCSPELPFAPFSVGWCNVEADGILKQLPGTTDRVARIELLDRLFELEADDVIGLPLFADPVVSAWRVDQLAGPIGTWAGTPYGLFFNVNDWTVAG